MTARRSIREALIHAAAVLRTGLEPHFAADTSVDGVLDETCPSRGHCAAVAVITRCAWQARPPAEGAETRYASATVEGTRHWFVRVQTREGTYDVDLTGDQFGRPAVQVAESGSLYGGTRERRNDEADEATRARASRLARRAGIDVDA